MLASLPHHSRSHHHHPNPCRRRYSGHHLHQNPCWRRYRAHPPRPPPPPKPMLAALPRPALDPISTQPMPSLPPAQSLRLPAHCAAAHLSLAKPSPIQPSCHERGWVSIHFLFSLPFSLHCGMPMSAMYRDAGEFPVQSPKGSWFFVRLVCIIFAYFTFVNQAICIP